MGIPNNRLASERLILALDRRLVENSIFTLTPYGYNICLFIRICQEGGIGRYAYGRMEENGHSEGIGGFWKRVKGELGEIEANFGRLALKTSGKTSHIGWGNGRVSGEPSGGTGRFEGQTTNEGILRIHI